MESVMAAAAVTEIFLASVAVATLLAVLALRGAFWLMRGTATSPRFVWREFWRAHFAKPTAELAPIRVFTTHRIH